MSTKSTSQSQQEVTAINSQDQSISSESVQDGSFGNQFGQMKRVMFMGKLDFGANPMPVDVSQTMARIPYTYSDPYCGGLFSAYGPQTMVSPQMVGLGPTRVALDLAEDGPIYVNAKQYNGILRRRQARAKLEAQNKLIKARRPYLHESRHLHAVKRVRGSGGRFLSTKKLQNTEFAGPMDANSGSNSGQNRVPEIEGDRRTDVNFSHTDVTFRQPDRGFSGYSYMMCGGNQQRAPVVR